MALTNSRRSPIVRHPYLVGVLSCVTGSVILLVGLFFACPPFSHSGCGQSGLVPLVWIAGTMLGLVVILAVVLPGGARFALAFCVALLLVSVGTRGLLFKLWAAPVNAITRAARPQWAPITALRQSSARKRQWIATTSAQTLEPIHGVRMARLLQDCIERYRGADPLGSYPHNADAVTSAVDCAPLVRDRIDLEETDSSRYTLGEDHGYRWSYSPAAADGEGRVLRYAIRVEPDSLINKPGPIYLGDENGLLVERARADAPAMAVGSPAAILKDLLPCVAQLDAERRRRRARQNYTYYSDPTAFEAATSACPDLAGRLRKDESSPGVTLSVPIHEHRGEFLDTAAVYLLTYTPLDIEGITFELRATPIAMRGGRIRSGVRRYFVSGDGTLYVTREARDATALDSAPEACEVEPRTPCAARGPGHGKQDVIRR